MSQKMTDGLTRWVLFQKLATNMLSEHINHKSSLVDKQQTGLSPGRSYIDILFMIGKITGKELIKTNQILSVL